MRSLKAMLTVALAAMLIMEAVHAFPTQAGSCAARGNALGGLHWYNMQAGGGPLSDYGLELRIDGTSLSPGGFKQISVGTRHSIELVSTIPSNTFRGFLMRLESPDVDTVEALSVPANVNNIQISKLMCVNIEGVGGLTHTGREDKNRVKGFLQVDEQAWDLYLEVTVVVQNSLGISEWYYSEYTFEAVSLPPPTTSPPTKAPISPTPNPTVAPTRRPTNAPTPRPTPKPTKRPTPAPSPFPTRQPVEPPSQNPTMVPSSAPSHQPTERPTMKPTRRPTPAPTTKPTTKPLVPTVKPTLSPTGHPSQSPSMSPWKRPSESPSEAPTAAPSMHPTSAISSPSSLPTLSESPTELSSTAPLTMIPTMDNVDNGKPSMEPSQIPSNMLLSESSAPSVLDEQDTERPSTFPSPSTTGQSWSDSPTFMPLPTRKPTGSSINALTGDTSAAASSRQMGIVWTCCILAAIAFYGHC